MCRHWHRARSTSSKPRQPRKTQLSPRRSSPSLRSVSVHVCVCKQVCVYVWVCPPRSSFTLMCVCVCVCVIGSWFSDSLLMLMLMLMLMLLLIFDVGKRSGYTWKRSGYTWKRSGYTWKTSWYTWKQFKHASILNMQAVYYSVARLWKNWCLLVVFVEYMRCFGLGDGWGSSEHPSDVFCLSRVIVCKHWRSRQVGGLDCATWFRIVPLDPTDANTHTTHTCTHTGEGEGAASCWDRSWHGAGCCWRPWK